MGELSLFQAVHFNTTICCKCGVRFALPTTLLQSLKDSKSTFYCPNGHSLAFNGETEAEKLQKRLDLEKNRRESVERQLASAESARDTARKAEAIAKGKLKAQSERVKHGVCPCCKRTVKQLAAHMKTKHPGWSGEST